MIRPEMVIAQNMGEKPVYQVNDLQRIMGSRATAYRLLGELREVGFADKVKDGFFTIHSSLFQPFHLWSYLLPSLLAIKQARYFGLSYNENDIRLARRLIEGVVTLDYRAYELTGFQLPHKLFMYVDDVDTAAATLGKHEFSEGTRGRVAIMPRTGHFSNEIQRVYLDCIASGGRSMLDAIAIEIVHHRKLDPKVRGAFKSEDVLKVREELIQPEPRTGSN